jgi:hypothetical protein
MPSDKSQPQIVVSSSKRFPNTMGYKIMLKAEVIELLDPLQLYMIATSRPSHHRTETENSV